MHSVRLQSSAVRRADPSSAHAPWRRVRAATARVLLVASVSAALSGCSVVSSAGTPPAAAPAPSGGPYEPVRRAGDLLFLAGQIGARADGSLEPGGIGPETRRALERVKALVESEGSTMDRVVKCSVFLLDISEWDAMNAVYTTFFTGRKPARTAVGSIGIPAGGRVEIECIATVS